MPLRMDREYSAVGWETKNLGDICENLDSKRVPVTQSSRKAGIIPYYGASGIVDYVADYIFDEDLLLVSEDGANLLARTYPIAFSITGKAWVNNHAHVLRFAESTTQSFVEYYLNSISLEPYVSGMAQPKLNQKSLNSINIPIPPLPEQKRIVSIVDEAFEGIDRAIANTEKNLTNARELFESYLNTVFTQRDSVPTVAIGDIGEVFDGPHATPKTIDSGPIFLGISSLQDGSIKLEKTRHVSPEDFQRWTRRVKPRTDDIVFSYETRLGQAAIIPEGLECCLGRRMGLVRVDKTQIEPLYFLYLYLSMPFQKFLNKKTVRGATVDRISIKEVPSFSIPLPDLEEQKSIVSKVDALSVEIQRLEAIYRQKLAALIELKQSVLQKAFTGELTADTANQVTKTAKEVIAA